MNNPQRELGSFKKFLGRSENEDSSGDFQVPRKISQLKSLDQRIEELGKEHRNMVKRLSDTTAEGIEEALRDYFARDEHVFLKFFLTKDYRPVWLERNTDKVFFDIETLFLPNNKEVQRKTNKNSHYIEHQRLGIAVSIDDNGKVRCWDETEVSDFIDYLLEFEEIITFNGLKFDNFILKGYIDNEDKFQSLYNRSFDLMQYDKHLINKTRRSLNQIANYYLQEGKYGISDSRNVPQLLREGSPRKKRELWRYCYKDVYLLVKLYEHLEINIGGRVKFQEVYQGTIGRDFEGFVIGEMESLSPEQIEQLRFYTTPPPTYKG